MNNTRKCLAILHDALIAGVKVQGFNYNTDEALNIVLEYPVVDGVIEGLNEWCEDTNITFKSTSPYTLTVSF